MILLGITIIIGDAGFEPRTSAPEVCCTANEPAHLTLIALRGDKVLDEGVRGLGVEGEGVMQGLQLLRLGIIIITGIH